MKSILLFFLLFTISYSQNITCSNIYFGRPGEQCVPGSDSQRQCKEFLNCVNNVCQEAFPGSDCNIDTDCIFSSLLQEGVKCIKGVCVKRRYSGYVCSQNEDCYTETCKGGVCVGKQLGDICNPLLPVTCDKELYCSYTDKVCKAQKKVNENCDDYEPLDESLIPAGSNYMIICPGGTKCTKTVNSTQTPICKRIYFRNEGDTCTTPDDCHLGLDCINQICTRIPIITPCGAFNCTENQQCLCGANGAPPSCQTVENSCSLVDALHKWTDCWAQNNCKYQRNPYNSMQTEMFTRETCMGQLCSEIAKEYFCCLFKGWEFNRFSNAYATPLGCASSGFVIAFVVILLLLFVAVTFGGIIGIGYYFYQHTYVLPGHHHTNTSFEKIVE